MSSLQPTRWSKDRHQAMAQLAGLFPTLDGAPGVNPWKASQFVQWAASHRHCSGSAHAVRFVLSIWNPGADWRQILKEAEARHEDQLPYQTLQQLQQRASAHLTETLQRTPTAAMQKKTVEKWLELFGPFNLSDAFAVWDLKHRAAMSAWIADPFWP